MKKQYTQPEIELRMVLALEVVSASSDGMTGDDNEFDVGDMWTDF